MTAVPWRRGDNLFTVGRWVSNGYWIVDRNLCPDIPDRFTVRYLLKSDFEKSQRPEKYMMDGQQVELIQHGSFDALNLRGWPMTGRSPFPVVKVITASYRPLIDAGLFDRVSRVCSGLEMLGSRRSVYWTAGSNAVAAVLGFYGRDDDFRLGEVAA